MAVAYVSDAEQANIDQVGSVAFTSYAIGATANPAVVVAVGLENNATVSVASVVASAGLTCANAGNGANNGVLVRAQNESGSGGSRVEVWKLAAPVGTGTITVTLTGGVSDVQAFAALLSGAHQTDPCPAADAESTSGQATPNPLVVTMANVGANDATIAMGVNYLGGDNPHVQSPVTEIYYNNNGNVNASGGYRLGAGSVSCLYGTPDHTVLVGVRVVAAATGPGPNDLRVVLGEPTIGSSSF